MSAFLRAGAALGAYRYVKILGAMAAVARVMGQWQRANEIIETMGALDAIYGEAVS